MKVMRYGFIIILIGVAGAVLFYLGTHLDAIPPFLNGTLMMALPIALGVFLIRRFGVRWRTFFLGSATFVASQVLHIPFNMFVLNPWMGAQGWQMESGAGIWIIAGLLGVSAGLFEESARYIFMSLWMSVRRNWRNGLMFGAGHGGIEAFLLGALTFYSFLQAAALRGMDISVLGTPEQVADIQTFLDTYWSYPWYIHLAGAIERVSALLLHIAATLIVLRGVQRRNPLWVLPAIALHTGLNAVAVYGSTQWDVMVTEGAIFAVALVCLGIIFLLRDDDHMIADEEPLLDDVPVSPPAPAPARSAVDAADIEDSRYD